MSSGTSAEIEVLAERARLLLQLRRAPEAEREARAALVKDPQNPAGHLLLALALFVQQDRDEALAAANRGIGLIPAHWAGHWVAGVILAESNRTDEALLALRNALALGPEEPAVHEWLARVHLAIGHHRTAAAAASEGLRLAPEDADLAEVMAVALAQLGDKAGARQYASMAIQLAPEAPGVHRAYGLAMLVTGDRRAATDSFREFLRLAPDDGDGPSFLVAALRRRNPLRRLEDFFNGLRLMPRRSLLWWLAAVLLPPIFAVTILLTLAAWVSWVAHALTTLSIHRDPRDRLLLSAWEVRAARTTAGLLGSGVVLLGLVAGLQSPGLVMAGVALLGLITPVQETTLLTGARRMVFAACAAALAVAQATLFTLSFLGVVSLIPSLLTFYVSLASTWPANLLQPRDERSATQN